MVFFNWDGEITRQDIQDGWNKVEDAAKDTKNGVKNWCNATDDDDDKEWYDPRNWG